MFPDRLFSFICVPTFSQLWTNWFLCLFLNLIFTEEKDKNFLCLARLLSPSRLPSSSTLSSDKASSPEMEFQAPPPWQLLLGPFSRTICQILAPKLILSLETQAGGTHSCLSIHASALGWTSEEKIYLQLIPASKTSTFGELLLLTCRFAVQMRLSSLPQLQAMTIPETRHLADL